MNQFHCFLPSFSKFPVRLVVISNGKNSSSENCRRDRILNQWRYSTVHLLRLSYRLEWHGTSHWPRTSISTKSSSTHSRHVHYSKLAQLILAQAIRSLTGRSRVQSPTWSRVKLWATSVHHKRPWTGTLNRWLYPGDLKERTHFSKRVT